MSATRRARGLRAPLLLAIFLVPVAALVWLTWELLDREAALETRQLEQRAAQAADRITDAAHRRLSELQAELDAMLAGNRPVSTDHTVVVAGGRATPALESARGLVFRPTLPAPAGPAAAASANGTVIQYGRSRRRHPTARTASLRHGSIGFPHSAGLRSCPP